jgi:hypothetical protein
MSSAVGAPGLFAPVLERLGEDAAAYFAQGPLRLVPERYEERAATHVLRLGVHRRDQNGAIGHVFVKVFKPRDIPGGRQAMEARVARDFETTRRVYDAMRGESEVGVVPPVACYPEWLALVTQEIEGPTLLDYLSTWAAWFPRPQVLAQLRETMATTGRWLRVFQSIEPPHGAVTIDELRRYIDVRLERLAKDPTSRFGERDRRRVLGHLQHLAPLVSPEDLRAVPVHADLALGNVLVSGSRIVVLDFGMAKHGTRLHDLTRLYVQIDLIGLKPQFRQGVVRTLQRALVDGFDPRLSPDQPLFRLLLLLHRINHLTTLTVKRGFAAEAAYNFMVRRQHRRWIAAEVAGTDRRGGAP